MRVGVGRICGRVFVACLLASAGPAAAESPVPAWAGVKRLVVLCQATAPAPHDAQVVTRALCERAAAIARQQAPVPVDAVTYGDPALSTAGTVALLVHGAVTEVAPRRLGLVVAARTDHRAMAHPDNSHFGATPRVAPFTSATAPAAWDPVLTASLDEILPWSRGSKR